MAGLQIPPGRAVSSQRDGDKSPVPGAVRVPRRRWQLSAAHLWAAACAGGERDGNEKPRRGLASETAQCQALGGGQPQLQITGEQPEEEALAQRVLLLQHLKQARPSPADQGKSYSLDCSVDFTVPEVTYAANLIANIGQPSVLVMIDVGIKIVLGRGNVWSAGASRDAARHSSGRQPDLQQKVWQSCRSVGWEGRGVLVINFCEVKA